MQRQKGRFLGAVAVACGTVWTAPAAATESMDGITIIEFAGGQDALPGGDHIVTFVSSRGSYAAVAGRGRGCLATAVPGSYTGRSITFGVDAPLDARRHGLDTLCPRFALTLESDGVRVEAEPRYSRRHRVLARVPLVSVDFGAPHFRRHDVKGVRLGPLLSREDLGPLRPASHPNAYVYRNFRRDVGVEAGKRRNVQGRAAPAEITGWPWDVLYSAHYYREYEATVPLEGLQDALFEQYGPPSAEAADGMQWYWFYDLEGMLTKPEGGAGPCAETLGYWLHQDANGRVTSLSTPANKHDLGAWGCSLLMDINARSSSGGVTHYSLSMVSGYTMAISHFFQRIEEAMAVKERIDALHNTLPVVD
ncbi:hypothetical protein C7H85_16220 [Zobellella endophytica]|uniref:Uncharacterized protein n=1 Tax=Zobellella endophytica TaxID=2116700 RepID=A0A2P7R0Q3_9GAMM|nr:hypothetical protein [Zobellella endophytica]PSJ43789.1 hypothetical protein C7H85_16220 [Zobellella endophytica]